MGEISVVQHGNYYSRNRRQSSSELFRGTAHLTESPKHMHLIGVKQRGSV